MKIRKIIWKMLPKITIMSLKLLLPLINFTKNSEQALVQTNKAVAEDVPELVLKEFFFSCNKKYVVQVCTKKTSQ